MKGLYQILAEDYRDFQAHEPARKQAKQLIEANRPSKVKETLKESTNVNIDNAGNVNVSVTPDVPAVPTEVPVIEEPIIDESCKKETDKVIKGSEEEDNKKSLVTEDEETEEDDEDDEETEEEEESSEEEINIDTKEDAINFLIKDEEDAKAGYEKVLAKLDSYDIDEELKALFIEKINEIIKDEEDHIAILNGLAEGKDISDEQLEDTTVEEVIEEPFEECEIASFKVTRIAPKFGVVMLEAQTKEGLKYITGKNFNESEKTLDDAEISGDKTAASNRFKSLLK